MPIYARRCKKCGHKFETFAKMAKSSRIRCELCRGATEHDVAAQRAPGVPKEKLVGTRSRLWDRSCLPGEVNDVRRELAGTGIEVDDEGRFFAPDKTSAGKFYHWEHDIRREHAEKREEAAAKAATIEPPKGADNPDMAHN